VPANDLSLRTMSVSSANTPVSSGLVDVRGNVSVTYLVD
jgi:hypothetical protein